MPPPSALDLRLSTKNNVTFSRQSIRFPALDHESPIENIGVLCALAVEMAPWKNVQKNLKKN